MCNYVRFELGRKFPPVLKIVTCPAHVRCIDISHYALLLSTHVTRCSIFSTVQYYCPYYGLLLELHALTLAARSYVLLSASILVLLDMSCSRNLNQATRHLPFGGGGGGGGLDGLV